MYLEKKKRASEREKRDIESDRGIGLIKKKKRKIDVIYIVHVTLPLNSHYLRK